MPPDDRPHRPDPTMLGRLNDAARDLQTEASADDALQVAADLAHHNVSGCDAAAISIVSGRGERLETVAATHEDALAGDMLQYELREGPCLDAAWHERTVVSGDLALDQRWPTWGPRIAHDRGIASMLCVRLFTHADTLGALNLYSRRRAGFDSEDRDEAIALAAHVAVALAAARRIEQLDQALDSRTVIGQATGLIMGRYRMDSATAFRLLARLSSERNIKIRDLAHQVVETRDL